MADIGKAPDGFPRVMQAARALAGLTIDELAAKLHEEEHVSARTLRAIESGSRKTLAPARRRAIIRACDQPEVMADLGFDIWELQFVFEEMNRLPTDLLEREAIPQQLIRMAFQALRERERNQGASDPDERQAALRLVHELRASLDRAEKSLTGPPPQ